MDITTEYMELFKFRRSWASFPSEDDPPAPILFADLLQRPVGKKTPGT